MFSNRHAGLNQAIFLLNTFNPTHGRSSNVKVSHTGPGGELWMHHRMFESVFVCKHHEVAATPLATKCGALRNCKSPGTAKDKAVQCSELRLSIPAPVEDESMAGHQTPDSAELQMGSGCVLLVEDEELLRSTALEILTFLGYDVIMAENGEEALDVFRRERDRIDVVMLDIMMPVMDGYECFRELRKIDPDVKVLISSGFAKNAEGFDTTKLRGIKGIIPKPYRVVELSRSLARILKRS